MIRYAQAEQKNIELQDKLQKSETRIREWTKEREVAMSKWHGMRNDNLRMIKLIETKVGRHLLGGISLCKFLFSKGAIYWEGFFIL